MTATAKSPMADLIADEKAIPLPPRAGELVTGTVVSKRNNKILVEIGDAYTGMISGREVADGMDTAKNLEVGDAVEAFVVEDENELGHYVLSLRKAGRERAWDELTRLMENGEAIEARIKEANKGGLMSEIAGIRAFIPVSQLTPEHYPRVNGANAAEILHRLQSYVGEKFTVKVINVDKENTKLILSEKAALSEVRGVELKKLSVGQTVKGKVSGIVHFGVFLLFNDCLEGLVHLSEIAWGHVADPAAHARIGEEKEAVVIGIEGDKISLSIKRLLPDPWEELVADYEVGDTVKGTVNKITPFGAFVSLKENLNGLIHISEVAQKEGDDGMEVDLEIGQEVEVKIISIDTAEHRLGLSYKKDEE